MRPIDQDGDARTEESSAADRHADGDITFQQKTTAGKFLNWDRLRIFQAVIDAGSFSGAARALGLSQSAVSRRISALEADLNVALFQRNPRGIQLTETGDVLLRTVQNMSSDLATGLVHIDETRHSPVGPLRITTSVAFGSAWLTPRMNHFLTLYPNIAISLLLVDNVELDLTLRQADVAIRFAPQTQPNLIERRIMAVRYHVFASQDYLQAHGVPMTAEDLDRHRLIVFGEDSQAPVENMNWLLTVGAEQGKPRKPALRVNSVYGIYRAVRSGLGIGALPYYLSEESPNLLEILPDLEGPRIDAFFVYPEELRNSKRIAVVRDFLLQQIDDLAERRELRRTSGRTISATG